MAKIYRSSDIPRAAAMRSTVSPILLFGVDALDPVGLYFGTTSGELWTSRDEGRRWTSIARHLPEIYAVEAAEVR